ncbi:MAG TPA: hypothetical protein VMW07_07410 [Gallionella sp.]|nr:hypothetical protein [Gallionella sp.]
MKRKNGVRQVRSDGGRFEALLELSLNQRAFIRCDVLVFFGMQHFSMR